MTPNTHEAGKVSDERLRRLLELVEGADFVGTGALGEGLGDQEEVIAIIGAVDVALSELRTRRAESQTCAVRVKALEAGIHELYGFNPDEAFGPEEGALRRDRFARAVSVYLSALEPTPIKETAPAGGEYGEFTPISVGTSTASLAVPADVQGVTDALIVVGARALAMGTDLTLPWKELCTMSELVLTAALSDYQRLAAENERLRGEIERINAAALDDVSSLTARAETAEGKLAEVVKVLKSIAADTVQTAFGEKSTDGASLAHSFLASLTSPPTEQGEK